MGRVEVEGKYGFYDTEVEDTQIEAARGHVCRCDECDPFLATSLVYGDVDGRTSPDHRSSRFSDWYRRPGEPGWYEIMLNGYPVRQVYEVDRSRGIVWAYRDPLHVCMTCLRADRLWGVCAVRLTGTVTFLTS